MTDLAKNQDISGKRAAEGGAAQLESTADAMIKRIEALGIGPHSPRSRLPTDLSFPERFLLAVDLLPEAERGAVLGKSDRQIYRYAQGADVPLSVVQRLIERANVPADWLLSGAVAPAHDPRDFAYLPRYEARASAGSGLVAVTEHVAEELAFRRDWLSRLGLNPENCGVVSAEGDSMWPTIPDRAIMVVDFSIREIRNGMIYVMVREGELIVKRVQTKGGAVVLISDNDRYERETISRDDLVELNIAGRVVWVGHTI